MQTPFFSVIIPTYNRATFIPKAIESVINQTYEDWELIIIDDGSTDNTKEIITQFTDNDKRIVYFYQQNSERSSARNKGISISKGKYICFLDSDDIYLPYHLQSLYEFIKQNNFPLALIFTDCFFKKDEELLNYTLPPLDNHNPIIYFLQNPVAPLRVCIHKEILKIYKFHTDITVGEDTILWVNIANSFPVFHLPQKTTIYHIHEDNSVNIKYNCFKYRLLGLRKLFNQKDLKKKIPLKIKRQLISESYFGIARHYEYKRNFFKMVLNLLLSIAYSPFLPQTKSKFYMIYAYFKK